MTNTINSKRFVIRKSLIGKDTTINVEFKNGKSCTYNHDEVYNIMKSTLDKLTLLLSSIIHTLVQLMYLCL